MSKHLIFKTPNVKTPKNETPKVSKRLIYKTPNVKTPKDKTSKLSKHLKTIQSVKKVQIFKILISPLILKLCSDTFVLKECNMLVQLASAGTYLNPKCLLFHYFYDFMFFFLTTNFLISFA